HAAASVSDTGEGPRAAAETRLPGRVRCARKLRTRPPAADNRREKASANSRYSSVAQVEQSASERVAEARDRYVARGVATPRMVVALAEGAHVTDADGRTFLDFAGGIACQNTGHRFEPVVAAIHEQVHRYLHQCFMVGTYEPYVEVCRRLAELSPCRGAEQKSLLVNSGAEGIENAVKIARAA